MQLNPLNDTENIRQHRNLTNSQKKTSLQTKEGVVINSAVKENTISFNDTKNNLLITDNTQLPQKLYLDKQKSNMNLLPLSGIALGVMSSIALLSTFIKRSAIIAQNTAKEKWLPAVTRNVNLSKETSQIIYQMVQSPNHKTFIAGAGVLALSSMTFMGKMFFDGYKDIWIKRKEATIQKNLQENLIEVETQAFSGKMQIIRSMLSQYTKDFEEFIGTSLNNNELSFQKLKFPFMGNNKDKKEQKNNNLTNIIIGIGTTLGILGLGYHSIKNLSSSKINLGKILVNTKKAITDIVKTSDETTKNTDKNNLEHLFISIEGSENIEEFITEQVKNLNWTNKEEKEKFLNKILNKIKTSTTKVNPNIGGDGTPKPAFNSFVDDYRAFFYNWLLEPSNPQFKQLFLGVTGVAGLSYGGKLAGDAIKEVQVKKINAQTELELQKNLVSTELRNFKAKKDSAIKPLVEEFYKQARSGKKSKEELKNLAENILFEIKNGAPYVYS